MTSDNDEGISELIDETLILALVVITALIVGFILLGYVIPIEKTAYVVPAFSAQVASGKTVITAFDRGGDPLYFNATSLAKYRAILYIDTALGTYTAEPVPGLTVFKPGNIIYVYYTGSAFRMADTLTGATFQTLPSGRVAVRLVDANSGTLIAQETVVQGPVIPMPTANATPPATPSPTISVTSTPVYGTLVANFDWTEKGKGGDVHFTDISTGSPTSWQWDFGDGKTSAQQNPVHNFGKSAHFTVTLTITRSSDSATGSVSKTITTI